jgi:hypothetical protein
VAGPENISNIYIIIDVLLAVLFMKMVTILVNFKRESGSYFLEEDDIFGIAKVHFVERERFGVFIVYFEEWYGDGQTNHVEIQGAEHSPCLS